MKTKCACGLLVLLLSSTVPAPFPVQAGSHALAWTAVDKPGEDGNIVVSPSEVSEIAVGSDGVIYAIDSSENSKVYRSLNSGVTWKDITDKLVNEGAELPAIKITVAPDKPGTVAVVTNNGTEVYLSTDGGTDWTNTSVPSLEGTIQAIAISKEYTQSGEDYRGIAIGTAVWGDSATTGQVWVRQLGETVPSWQNLNLTVDPAHIGGEVSALAYSPDYPDDPVILAVASTSDGSDVAADYRNGTWLCLFDGASWNSLADYPVEITLAGDGLGVSRIYSSLALPSDYSSEEAESRQLFVSYDREPDANDDVYSVSDATPYRLDADGGNDIDISSIAYYGTVTSGKLLAGDVSPIVGSLTVQVRRTANPWDLAPTWELASVPPTGPGNAKMGWSPDGEIAYCGTGQIPGEALDESAFSISLDDGDKWRQMGLMDTVIRLADIVPAPDSKSLFITTYSPFGPEGIWRTAGDPLGGRWERLLTMDTSTDAVILRRSLNYSDDDTMYAAEVGGSQMAVSHNRGNSWEWCRGRPGLVVDMVVGDEETMYVALPGGYVRKSVNGAFTWQGAENTHLSDINMLAIVDEETILVGGKNGDVSYSTDGGASFSQIRGVIGNGSGDVQVVADANYQKNSIIYAATDVNDEGVWRWVIGVSTEWEQIDESITGLDDGQRIGGLAVGSEGTLYALRLEPATSTSGGITRSLNPSVSDATEVEFELVNNTLPAGSTFDPAPLFPNIPPYLQLSGNARQNELWTIDTSNQIIYRFQDTLCKVGPAPEMPEAGGIAPIDSSGYVTSLTLRWEELEGTEEYEAVIYQDSDANQSLWSGTTTGNAVNATKANDPAQLLSGDTYYWRVRSIEPVKSPWSQFRSFTPALGNGQWSPLAAPAGISPLPGTTNVPIRPAFAWQPADWATGYEFVLARDSQFTDVVATMTGADALPTPVWGYDRDLDYSTTYFWKVRAISDTSYSEWGTGVFTTEPPPPAPMLPQSSPPPSPPQEPALPDYLLWIVLGTGVTLVLSLVVLIVRTGSS
jgi:photosystem II stability/assembly factor-like uncharacterized protein